VRQQFDIVKRTTHAHLPRAWARRSHTPPSPGGVAHAWAPASGLTCLSLKEVAAARTASEGGLALEDGLQRGLQNGLQLLSLERRQVKKGLPASEGEAKLIHCDPLLSQSVQQRCLCADTCCLSFELNNSTQTYVHNVRQGQESFP